MSVLMCQTQKDYRKMEDAYVDTTEKTNLQIFN